MKTKIATVIAMAMLSAPVMAQQNLNSLDSQVFANQNIKAVELSQTEMKETQGEVAISCSSFGWLFWRKFGKYSKQSS